MHDGDQDNCAERCCSQRVEEAAAKDAQFDEDPTAEQGADQTQNNIRDAAITLAAGDFSCQPSGDQSDDNPTDQSAFVCDDDAIVINSLKKNTGKHRASGANGDQVRNLSLRF